jgi:ATP-dependent RNA helicase RhlE
MGKTQTGVFMESNNLSFSGLGIAPKILEIITRLQFKNATPIQHQSIPLALEGKDVLGIAQTGTGKTMAFAIPTVQRLAQEKGRALVIAPTRELALQVDESFVKIGRPYGMKTAVLIGGDSMNKQLRALSMHPRVLIATPGRLLDFMRQRKVHLSDIKILILDEADRMFDMGFSESIEQILKSVPKERQTLLFSATMPPAILSIVKNHMHLPMSVEIAPSGTKAKHVTHELFIVKKEMKKDLLEKLLHQYRGSVLLFCRTKKFAHRVTTSLRDSGHSAAEIHSDRSQAQRREALEGFRRGKYRVLVATDIAARGIDVKNIELVINYDLPDEAENYVHRIGRTGRAGTQGHAISFATADQREGVASIEKLLNAALPISKHPEVPSLEFDSSSSKPKSRGGLRSWTSHRRPQFNRRRR